MTLTPTPEQDDCIRERLRAEALIDPTTGCWLPPPGKRGKRRKNSASYTRIWLDGRQQRRHVVAFVAFHGPVPEGHEVCHHCDNPPCFNPEHLHAATHAENMREMVARGRKRGGAPRRTHCRRGHELTASNVYTRPNGDRQCRRCRYDKWRAWAAVNR
jgi:hypothetical protein